MMKTQPYDVFISYRQKDPDKTWVEDVLVKELRNRGLKVFIDYENFELGAPLVDEIARGIQQSKYTIGVFSPAYLESEFTKFEVILAQHLGLELATTRFIALRREDCELPLKLRGFLWLDVIDDTLVSSQLDRLMKRIKKLTKR